MRTVHPSIGERIAARRRNKGLNQAQLASRLRVFPSTVCRWESGETQPDASTVEKIAKILGLTMAQFYGPITSSSKRAVAA